MLEFFVRFGARLDGCGGGQAGTEVVFILGFGVAGEGEGVLALGFVIEVWGEGGC